ncbi:MAG: beta-propeller domain-containing protein [Desulfuromonadaceae bacterium]
MFWPTSRQYVSTLCLLFLLPLISACSNSSGNSPPSIKQPATVSAKLVIPANNDELERWLKAELVKNYQVRDVRYNYGTRGGTVPTADVSAIPGVSAQVSASSAAESYSSTNVQEKGVDEGDLVKTDGKYIYLARGNRFLVIKAQPPDQAAVVSSIDLNETISELHLAGAGSRVTIITTPYNVTVMTGVAIMPGVATTRVYSYDISTPAAPVLSSRFDFPGSLQGSRRINNTIYLITNYHIDIKSPVSAWNYLPTGNYSTEAYLQAGTRALTENLKLINAMTLAEMIPSYSRITYTGGVAGAPIVSPVVAGGDMYIPESGNGTDISLVISLDSSTATPVVASSGVISSGSQIYMSPENLYLASSNSWAWVEPVQGIALLPVNNPEPWTALHKFALATGAGKPLYKGSGMVTGWVNNQFSMGEYSGYLRIGTTRGGWWGEGISNRLAILTEQEGALVEKGRIEGLAQGEKIYSMRFDRDRAYMVTFRQTDPLFTFDLSDPLNPRKLGELKVDGFATYIHLVGQNNNRLLTVGRSADTNGRVTGNKLQLFDVTNMAAPALLGDYELGDGWSAALYDHHAFLFYDALGILAIPYYSYVTSTGSYNSGLKVFNINESSISLRGEIPAKTLSSGYGSYQDTVDRSVIIGTDIYAIAHRTVTVAGTAQLDIKKVVELPEGYYPQAL